MLRKIAHGGMAEIFLALQVGAEGFEKPVVLKRILPALSSDSSFVRMLVDEAHIASGLNHTHLVQVLDLGKAGDEFFLVLDFVDGWSLEQVRRRARKARLKMPLPLTLYIVSALCRGLEYVHRHTRNGKPLGIVHRDVTPQNVLLSREGDVKLADFGIAKAAGRREKSATGVIKGKFAYMSPEQTIGAELDARSDLFSVGTLLYVLTTGQKPFDAPSDLDVLMQVRKARHEKPSTLVRDFNPDVERFIERALRADRARRWQSAEQMADRLDGILIKLAQPSGPAALKRWLEALSARDGVAPPGDLRAAAPEPPTSTIQLVSGELELHEVAPEADEDEDEVSTRREARKGRKRPGSAGAGASRAVGTAASVGARLMSAASESAEVSVHPEEGTVFHELALREPQPAEPLVARAPDRHDAQAAPRAAAGRASEHHQEAEPSPSAAEEDSPSDASNTDASETDDELDDISPTGARALEASDAIPELANLGSDAEDEDETSARPFVEGETASALLLTEPRRPRARRFRRTRIALALLLAPALLGGGAYFARPFLPTWMVPAAVVAWVDGWLEGWLGDWRERLPIPHSLRERAPAAPVHADTEASNR